MATQNPYEDALQLCQDENGLYLETPDGERIKFVRHMTIEKEYKNTATALVEVVVKDSK